MPKDWLESILDDTSHIESPKSFVYWAALCAVSAVINNKVFIDKDGAYNLYPNLYVLTIAASGLRKGWPVALSKRFVSKVNCTRVISGRSSVQAIVKDLSQAKPMPGGKLIKDAIGYINSGEFSTSLVKDPDALTLLTDLHDGQYNPEWTNNLKGSGKEELKNVCVTLLGAMNQTHFNDMIGVKEISGGFIGRCIVVLEEKRRVKNALIRKTGRKIDYDYYTDYLKKASALEGEFVLEEKAMKYFEDWYEAFEPELIEDRTGTANRLNDTILKVAMCLGVARRCDLVIPIEIMKEAIDVTLENSSGIQRILVSGGANGTSGATAEYAVKLKLFLADLIRAPGYVVERQKTLQKHYGEIDKWDLDRLVEHLIESGGIIVFKEGNNTMYRLTEKAIEALTKGRLADKVAEA